MRCMSLSAHKVEQHFRVCATSVPMQAFCDREIISLDDGTLNVFAVLNARQNNPCVT